MRNKWLVFYALLFAGFLEAITILGGGSSRVAASLMSVVLLVVPMVSVLYSAVYWYHAEGFTSIILAQPIGRLEVYLVRWLAISLSLSLSLTVGVVVPLIIKGSIDASIVALVAIGCFLTIIFVSLGQLIAVVTLDRMKGIGTAFLLWFYFVLVHDGLVFLMLVTFREYPVEIPVMVLTALDPVDLGRVVLLQVLDMTALMGYTGTIIKKFFGSGHGIITGVLVLSAWVLLPVWSGLRRFCKTDL